MLLLLKGEVPCAPGTRGSQGLGTVKGISCAVLSLLAGQCHYLRWAHSTAPQKWVWLTRHDFWSACLILSPCQVRVKWQWIFLDMADCPTNDRGLCKRSRSLLLPRTQRPLPQEPCHRQKIHKPSSHYLKINTAFWWLVVKKTQQFTGSPCPASSID